jgi:hypothetical protein
MAAKRTTARAASNTVRFFQPAKGRNVRRHTVYISESVAKRLAYYCAEYNFTLSEAMEESLKQTLPRLPARGR